MDRYIFELSRCNETIADVKGALRGGLNFLEGYKKFVIDCMNTDDFGAEDEHLAT